MTLTSAPPARPGRRDDDGPARVGHRWWPALLPAAVLAVLGGTLVGRRPALWFDELYTVEVGQAGLGELARAVWTGTGTTTYLADAPPSYNAPYYVVVRLWLALTRLPADDVGLRLLSLVAAVAAVVVLVRAVQRLAGTAVGLAAGLVAATNPLVVEYSAEARMYALALLALATTVLGLARWLDGAPRGLLLLGIGALASGSAHWFTAPVVAGLVVAALVLRRRAALPVVAVGALAALVPGVLLALTQVNGTGSSLVRWIPAADGPVPALAMQAWAGWQPGLLVVVLLAVAAAGVAAARRPSLRPAAVVALCWTGVPLVLLQLAELARPVYVPRYALPALVGLALLTALGTGSWRRAVAVPATAGLVVASLLACLPLLDRGPRDGSRAAVAALAAVHAPGEQVVAVDHRGALALVHYAPPAVRADLRLPPDDPTAGPEVVWLLRQSIDQQVQRSDDDDLLERRGMRVVDQQRFPGPDGDLLLQRWKRAET